MWSENPTRLLLAGFLITVNREALRHPSVAFRGNISQSDVLLPWNEFFLVKTAESSVRAGGMAVNSCFEDVNRRMRFHGRRMPLHKRALGLMSAGR